MKYLLLQHRVRTQYNIVAMQDNCVQESIGTWFGTVIELQGRKLSPSIHWGNPYISGHKILIESDTPIDFDAYPELLI